MDDRRPRLCVRRASRAHGREMRRAEQRSITTTAAHPSRAGADDTAPRARHVPRDVDEC